MAIKSFELLDKLLAESRINPDDLDALYRERVREDLYIEYKHGNELLENNASSTIRKYISGFANSAGGILIFGINAPDGVPGEITGCLNHNKGNLAEWASRCLTPIANLLIPPPRFQVFLHEKGEILLIATQRCPTLVPVTENNVFAYYFRFHDQTLRAPEYLVSDLVLGKRQQPNFTVSNCLISNLRRSIRQDQDVLNLEFTFGVHFENNNIIWADENKFGIIASALSFEDRYTGVRMNTPNSHLLNYIGNIPLSNDYLGEKPRLYHIFGSLDINQPFDTDARSMRFTLPLRKNIVWFTYTWMVAIYMVSKNTIPIWHQFIFTITSDFIANITDDLRLDTTSTNLELHKVTTERPFVGWGNFTAMSN